MHYAQQGVDGGGDIKKGKIKRIDLGMPVSLKGELGKRDYLGVPWSRNKNIRNSR